jgi:hypothetical protein
LFSRSQKPELSPNSILSSRLREREIAHVSWLQKSVTFVVQTIRIEADPLAFIVQILDGFDLNSLAVLSLNLLGAVMTVCAMRTGLMLADETLLTVHVSSL